ncbi:MAG: DUF1853 family protein [Winogradskyella sp.]
MSFSDRFKGFQNTPLLWHCDTIESLRQFSVPSTHQNYDHKANHKKLRLGKWIEIFTMFQLQQIEGIKIVAENLQIKHKKQTIGEIDVLLVNEEQPMHLEIAYKFYLYDDRQEYDSPLEYWIGPNRTDSLSLKLKKLVGKQLPLLHKSETKTVLNKLGFNNNQFKQFVNFKAQLFLPYRKLFIDFNVLNKECVKGSYIHFDEIEVLKKNQFYILSKLDWLVEPNLNVEWMNFDDTLIVLKKFITEKQSPLCWLKDENNELTKCFVTWW